MKDVGSVGIGGVCNVAVFIAAPRFFDGPRGLHQPGAFGRSDLRRSNERKHINVWLLRPSRFLGHVVALLEAAGHARAAAAQPAHRSRNQAPFAGRVHSSTAPALFQSPRRFRHRARLDGRAGSHHLWRLPGCHRRAALGVVRHVEARVGVRWVRGHFRGRITPGCTRRRRAFFSRQPVVNRCSVGAAPRLGSSPTFCFARRRSPPAEPTRGAAGEPGR